MSWPATTPAALDRLEDHLAALRAGGFGPLAALEVVQNIAAYVVGHTLWSLAPRRAGREHRTVPSYAALDPERFGNVRAAAAALDGYDAEREFERGLDAMIEGLAR